MKTHIINRQVIDLNVRSKENAFAVQQRVQEVYFSEVLPLLDEVMSSMTAAGEILYIDRLEVDLGVLNYDQLSKEMTEGVRRKIREQINEQLRLAAEPLSIAKQEQHVDTVLKTETRSALELLRIFFTTGSIPWWADDEQAPPDIDELIVRLLEREPQQLLALLSEIIAHQPVAKRIIFQVSKNVRRQLLLTLPKNRVQLARAVLQQLIELMRRPETPAISTDEAEELVFIATMITGTDTGAVSEHRNEAVMLRALIEAMPTVLSVAATAVQQKIYRSLLFSLIHKPEQKDLQQSFILHFEEWERAEPALATEVSGSDGLSVALLIKKNSSGAEQQQLDKAIAQFLVVIGQQSRSKLIRKQHTNESPTEMPAPVAHTDPNIQSAEVISESDADPFVLPEEIRALLDPGEPLLNERKEAHLALTRYAGLVLVAPFLPAFFEEMELLENGLFRTESARHKAIHFLNFMATNKTKAPEYSLALHKILCSAELKEPVPKNAKLNAEEKKAALLFLDDIAEQWTTLQGTSGEAFRETFMRRNGIIEQRVNALLLRIERAPMDVLLDTLPWNISIIRLPWMQQLLHVEW